MELSEKALEDREELEQRQDYEKRVSVTCLYTANKRNVVLLCAIEAKTERQYGGGGSRTPVLTVHPSTSTGLDPADES